MAYKRKTQEERAKEIEDLTSGMEARIPTYFRSRESVKEYMNFMGKFHNYSLNNGMLIDSQFRGAEAVGSFAFWKSKGFAVNKGEKGIKILVPKIVTYFDRNGKEVQLKFATKAEKEKIENKQIPSYTRTFFDVGHVFDVSQTNATAKDLPGIFPNRWLEGSVENYNSMYNALEKVAHANSIKIVEPYEELGVAKGASYTMLKEVALNPRNSELQNVKTLAHELAHAVMHTADTHGKYTTQEKEFQAEMVAYTVSNYFGLDTTEYSLPYLNHWTAGKELKDQEQLLKEVKDTSHEFISVIEKELIIERSIAMELINENTLGTVIYEHNNPEQQVLLLQDLNTNVQQEFQIDKSLNVMNDGKTYSLPNELLTRGNAENLNEAVRNSESTSFILSKEELFNLQERNMINQPIAKEKEGKDYYEELLAIQENNGLVSNTVEFDNRNFLEYLKKENPNDYIEYLTNKAFHEHERINEGEINIKEPMMFIHGVSTEFESFGQMNNLDLDDYKYAQTEYTVAIPDDEKAMMAISGFYDSERYAHPLHHLDKGNLVDKETYNLLENNYHDVLLKIEDKQIQAFASSIRGKIEKGELDLSPQVNDAPNNKSQVVSKVQSFEIER
ncbi:ImmA/IrrE family metallo-endopeptidase [Sporosarcina sp. G11-34]|uniref:ImmA/IrrE family metallo-endopeptidase n=1 Tax=Sporosarcina sp. G11-34 TaxID=2849605 RepID=UPI0022A9F338|nr:ImmA/IrrE family metallo-endopeptidase [Sporosarcina sp. G11-34]MCZ2260760.1 ImmA/IrrE family metallo-endopeptidase [Sporosarcina sp. G11-34]